MELPIMACCPSGQPPGGGAKDSHMSSRVILAFAACFTLLPAVARPAEQTRFQVVPQAGMRLGGSFRDATNGAGRELADAASLGVGLEWRVADENRWWQLWYSRQGTEVSTPDGGVDVDVEYLLVGGTAPIDDEGKFHSYVSGGLGAARLSPAAAGLGDATRFAASLGVGLTMPVSPRLAFRIEARGYLILLEADTSIFCRSDQTGGACQIVASGPTLFQAEITAGVAFGF
jgi:hypothetical protein